MTEKLYLPELPNSSMFVGLQEVMTTEWQEFFRSLFNRVGGITAPTLGEVSTFENIELYSTPKEWGKRIDNLEKQLQIIYSSKDYSKKIGELEKLIQSLITPKSYDQKIDDSNSSIFTIPSKVVKFLVMNHIRVGAHSWKLGVAGPIPGYISVWPTLIFDNVNNDEVHYSLIAPFSMTRGSVINVSVDWCHQIALDTGTVTWKMEYILVAEGESVPGATTTISGTSGASVTDLLQNTPLVTGIIGAEPHDRIGLRLYRDIAIGTLAGDASLIEVHFEYTKDKHGEKI